MTIALFILLRGITRANDEARMTNDETNPNAQMTKWYRVSLQLFGFRASFVIQEFVIRHSSFAITSCW